jgi:hypothetical protein
MTRLDIQKFDEDKVTGLVAQYNKLAKDSKSDLKEVELNDLFEEPLPAYFKWDDYDHASISFEDRAPGVVFRIKDCTYDGGVRIGQADTSKGMRPLMVSFVREHFGEIVVDGDGDKTAWTKIFNIDPPKPGAKFEEWDKWCGQISQKNFNRLTDGIYFFRKELGVEGKE